MIIKEFFKACWLAFSGVILFWVVGERFLPILVFAWFIFFLLGLLANVMVELILFYYRRRKEVSDASRDNGVHGHKHA